MANDSHSASISAKGTATLSSKIADVDLRAEHGSCIQLVHLGTALCGVCCANGNLCQDRPGGVDSDFATLIRTVIIFGVLCAFVLATGKRSNPLNLSGKTWSFLVLSGLATGASWVCYFER